MRIASLTLDVQRTLGAAGKLPGAGMLWCGPVALPGVLSCGSIASRGEVRGFVVAHRPAVQQAHAASDRPAS
jgi:hypothetical protein